MEFLRCVNWIGVSCRIWYPVVCYSCVSINGLITSVYVREEKASFFGLLPRHQAIY